MSPRTSGGGGVGGVVSVVGVVVLAVLGVLGGACTLSPYPSGAITCDPATPCPDGYACLDPRGDDQKTCVLIGCGDGQVDPASGEQCDDANDNNLDLCVSPFGAGSAAGSGRCEARGYVVDVDGIIGFGTGAADPETTPIGRPTVLAASSDGTLFVSSIGTNLVTRLESSSSSSSASSGASSDRRLTAFAGNGSLVSVESTTATPPNEVSTVFASSMALDGLGNLFVAVLQPSVIRRIDAVTGAATTVAGTELRASAGDDVVGDQSPVNLPRSLAIDGDGTVFFVERGPSELEQRVRRLDRVTGRLTTVLGPGQTPGPPDGLAFDDDGTLFVISADFLANEPDPDPTDDTTVVNHFLAVARVRLRDGVVDGPVLALTVPTFRERVVVELGPDGRPVIEDGQIKERSRTPFDQTTCFTPGSAQRRFALRGDGRRLFFASEQRFVQLELPGPDGAASDAVCTTLGEAPLTVEAGSAFDVAPSDVALVGDDVYVADPGNGVVWRVRADTSQQEPELIAGVLRPPGGDAFAELVDDIVLEFAKETDGHLGVGLTADCNDSDVLDLTSFEFFAAFPELHRVVLSDCANRISVIAGTGTPGFAGDGGPSTAAKLSRPAAAARGPDGHIYIADRDNNRVRRVLVVPGVGNASDVATTIETFLGPGNVTPPLKKPAGLAFDDDGGLLVADSGNDRVLRIDIATGAVTTVIGTGPNDDDDDDGRDDRAAVDTPLSEPSSMVFLPFRLLGDQLPVPLPGGLLVIAERGAHRIRATIVPPIERLPEVFTLAGDGVAGDRDDAVDGRNARFFRPRGLMLAPSAADLSAGAVSSLGFFVVDGVDRVRALSVTPEVGVEGFVLRTTVVTRTTLQDGVGAASRDDGGRDQALFRGPSALAVVDDAIAIVDRITGRLRLVTLASATVRTVAGLPDGISFDDDRDDDGDADDDDAALAGTVAANEAAPLVQPAGLALDDGVDPPQLFASESGAGRLRRFTLTDPADPTTWTTDVVILDVGDAADAGDAGSDGLERPTGLAIDVVGRALYVADADAQVVWRVDLTRAGSADEPAPTTIVAGVPFRRGATGDGGPPGRALFNEPEGVALIDDDTGAGARVLLVADTGNNRVRRIDLDDDDTSVAIIRTVLGDGDAASGGEGAPASAFPVQRPRGLAVDARGNLLVTSQNAIRFVQAGDDGGPDGDDDVRTISGKPPRAAFPEAVTRCLSDLALAPTNDLENEAPAVYAVDACLGVLLRLDRR